MLSYTLYNGTFVPSSSPFFNTDNRAFLYGDALFETIRIIAGKPCFLPDHLHRLRTGMELLKMEYPLALEAHSLEVAIQNLVVHNGLKGDGRLRLTVFRNGPGLYTPESNNVSYVAELHLVTQHGYTLNQRGKTVGIFEEQKKTINAFSRIKSTNCITYILAGIYKSEKGWDDCLILNDLGNLAESVSSNIFISFNGVLYTPALTQGCIEGVMRNQIIRIAKANRMEVQEIPMSPETLIRADEVFLTNAIQGVQWVGEFRGKTYENKIARFFVDKLNEETVSSRMDLQGM